MKLDADISITIYNSQISPLNRMHKTDLGILSDLTVPLNSCQRRHLLGNYCVDSK